MAGSLTPDPEALAALREAWGQVQAMGAESGVPQPPESPAAAEKAAGPESDAVAVAREIALRRLAVRARSRHELAQDLAKRELPAEAAAQVLDRFAEVGLVDDAAFAASWVESRGRRSGAARLRQELRQKGVGDEEIDQAIAARDDEADLEAARTLAIRKVATMARLDGPVRERRLGALLARRGFSSSVIRRVMSEVLGGGSGL